MKKPFVKEIVCPFCTTTAQQNVAKLKSEERPLTYRGIVFKVKSYFYVCPNCKEQFTTGEVDEMTLDQVHAQYRQIAKNLRDEHSHIN